MLFSIAPFLAFEQAQAQTVTLTVLNPRGYVERVPITPLAERLETLEGMRIVTYSISLPAKLLAIQSILEERVGPSGEVMHFGSANAKSGVGLADNHTAYESGVRAADAVIVATAF